MKTKEIQDHTQHVHEMPDAFSLFACQAPHFWGGFFSSAVSRASSLLHDFCTLETTRHFHRRFNLFVDCHNFNKCARRVEKFDNVSETCSMVSGEFRVELI